MHLTININNHTSSICSAIFFFNNRSFQWNLHPSVQSFNPQNTLLAASLFLFAVKFVCFFRKQKDATAVDWTRLKSLVEKKEMRGEGKWKEKKYLLTYSHPKNESKEAAQSVNLHGHRPIRSLHKCALSPFTFTHLTKKLHIPDHSYKLRSHWPSCCLSIRQPQLCDLPSSPPSSASFPRAHPFPHP